MADPVTTATNGAKSVLGTAWNATTTAYGWAKKSALPLALVVGLSFAMTPAAAAAVAVNPGTAQAATSLSTAVAQTISHTTQTVYAGLANSGPVWHAAGDAISNGWTGVTDFISSIDLTPGK
ncbi:MAG: hypothetical protein KDI13_09120 [Alphaproteobacteria bacterium]|nr:hypothetical protein [Alphaproteobacteria bacterium]